MKLRPLLLIVLALLAGPALAAKQIKVKQVDKTRYEVDAFTLGINELAGYLASLKEDEGLEQVVFLNTNADSEKDLSMIAARIGLKAVRKNGDPLPLPMPPPAPTAPAAPDAPAAAPSAPPAAPTAPEGPAAPEAPSAAPAEAPASPAAPEAPAAPEVPAVPAEEAAAAEATTEGDQH